MSVRHFVVLGLVVASCGGRAASDSVPTTEIASPSGSTDLTASPTSTAPSTAGDSTTTAPTVAPADPPATDPPATDPPPTTSTDSPDFIPSNDPTTVGMAPLSDDFRPRFEQFYKGVFLEDGYPGKATDEGTIAHPIYGTYVLADYLALLKVGDEQARPLLLSSLEKVADAVIDRMEPVPGTDALGFYYEPEWNLGARLIDRHYSGLTQAYYASVLERVSRALDDPRYSAAARQAYNSLLVDVADGGVLIPSDTGPAFAELPSDPESHVLNGWLSILAAMQIYADLVDDDEARAIIRSSADRLAELLPIYDVPELKNSAYGLTGFIRVRVRGAPAGTAFRDLRVEIPGASDVIIGIGDEDSSRWSSYVEPGALVDERSVASSFQMNIVVSGVSYPSPNVLKLSTDAPDGTTLALEGYVGVYDPHWSGPVTPEWVPFGSAVVADGVVGFELPWDQMGPIIYPTNFAKVIEDQNTNVYHLIHVKRLHELAEELDMPAFEEWAVKWEGYVCDWDELPVYDGFSVTSRGATTPVASVDEDLAFCS